MTKRGRFLLGATVALGMVGAWLELSANERVARAGSGDETLAFAEQTNEPSPEVRVNPAEPPVGEARRPHPITPMHEAMAERHELLGAVAAALQGKRYDVARALLGEAAELDPSAPDPSAPQKADPESSTFEGSVRGYHLILDCIAARAASANGSQELPHDLRLEARAYLEQQRLPPRREVRRVCLEGRAFARRG